MLYLHICVWCLPSQSMLYICNLLIFTLMKLSMKLKSGWTTATELLRWGKYTWSQYCRCWYPLLSPTLWRDKGRLTFLLFSFKTKIWQIPGLHWTSIFWKKRFNWFPGQQTYERFLLLWYDPGRVPSPVYPEGIIVRQWTLWRAEETRDDTGRPRSAGDWRLEDGHNLHRNDHL